MHVPCVPLSGFVFLVCDIGSCLLEDWQRAWMYDTAKPAAILLTYRLAAKRITKVARQETRAVGGRMA
jgi:hypothetical protein